MTGHGQYIAVEVSHQHVTLQYSSTSAPERHWLATHKQQPYRVTWLYQLNTVTGCQPTSLDSAGTRAINKLKQKHVFKSSSPPAERTVIDFHQPNDWRKRSALVCGRPVRTSNNVEATFDFVKATLDIVANKTATMSNEISSKLNMFNLFRLCHNYTDSK